MTGTVRRFIAEKGYGFITPDGGGADVFVHSSALADAGIRFLREGQRVEFDVEAGPKGPRAADVRPV